MKKYDPTKPIAFLHVPKCGGTSIRNYVSNYFEIFLNHYNGFDNKFGVDISYYPIKYNWKFLESASAKKRTCIYGHFRKSEHCFVSDYYPKIDQFATVLRDPLEVAISSHFYLKRLQRDGNLRTKVHESIDDWLRVANSEYENHLPDDFIHDPISTIEKNFVAIGIIEDVDKFKISFQRAIGIMSDDEISQENTADRFEQPSSEAIEIWRKRNRKSIEIYNAVKEFCAGN